MTKQERAARLKTYNDVQKALKAAIENMQAEFERIEGEKRKLFAENCEQANK